MSVRRWIQAFRPRTLLLSFSGVMMGGFLAVCKSTCNYWVLLFSLLTALSLQILSNLANDYGDFQKGVDDAQRVGPMRSLQGGDISVRSMQKALFFWGLLSAIFGCILVFVVAQLSWGALLIFAALGLAAIAAALLYTLGKRPYGYYGLGDIFCFIFFGLASVFGVFYLATKILDAWMLLPASAMGLMSVAVLNINNMRDYENDKAHHKNSMAVRLGLKWAFRYQISLIVMAFVFLFVFSLIKNLGVFSYLYLLSMPLFIFDLLQMKRVKSNQLYDPFLKRQSIHTFILTLLFGLGLLIS